MLNLIKRFTEYTTKRREEKRLIDSVLDYGNTQDVVILASFIEAQGKFTKALTSTKRCSISKRISYEMSPYGSIVKIDGGPLLDACPECYRLTEEQARILYDAIIVANGSDPGYERHVVFPELYHSDGSDATL